jgi:tripartite-type tricarboxylate transporter receptor subunit TctC
MKSKRNAVVLALVLFLFGSYANLSAQSAPFYHGKSIKIIVGFTSGGFYDRWSRPLSRYVPTYIAGNPEMIVQNMPGARGLIAARSCAR